MPRRLKLDIGQYMVGDPQGVPGSPLDCLITAASWDPRSTAIATMTETAEYNLVLRYANSGTTGRSSRHLAEIREWLVSREAVFDVMEFSSEELRPSFKQVWSRVALWSKELRRPLRAGVDLSVVPRYVSLGIMAEGFRANVLSEVSFFYKSAIYPERAQPSGESVSIRPRGLQPVGRWVSDPDRESPSIFTEGRWRTVYIPGLRGDYRPSSKSHFVLALGFEGDDTYRVVQQDEPDVVTAFVPDPPVYEGLVERCETDNDMLLREWVGQRGFRRCGALDAVGMFKALDGMFGDGENLVMLPVGTKPHALGMAVWSLVDGRPMVLYRMPQRHRESAGGVGDRAYVYHVVDRAAV